MQSLEQGEAVGLIVTDAEHELVLVTTSTWGTSEMWELLDELAEHRLGIEARVIHGAAWAKDRNSAPAAIAWPSREWLLIPPVEKTLAEKIVEFRTAFNGFMNDLTMRRGQAYFYALTVVDGELSIQVSDSEIDPYAHDERVPAFLAFVYSHWGGVL